jgi:hypothetical protein
MQRPLLSTCCSTPEPTDEKEIDGLSTHAFTRLGTFGCYVTETDATDMPRPSDLLPS